MDIEDTIAKQSLALTSTSAYDRHSNSLRSVVLPIILSDIIFNSIIMREIKFRAWHKKEKRMSHVNVFSQAEGWVHTPGEHGCYEVWNAGKYEIMQYTGLKDKNGKEIWNGDIVSLGSFDTLRAHIEYQHCSFVLVHKKDSERKQYCDNGVSEPIFKNCEVSLEVIGNIYENPDLLA